MPQEAASHHLRRTPLESSQSNIWKVVFSFAILMDCFCMLCAQLAEHLFADAGVTRQRESPATAAHSLTSQMLTL